MRAAASHEVPPLSMRRSLLDLVERFVKLAQRGFNISRAQIRERAIKRVVAVGDGIASLEIFHPVSKIALTLRTVGI